MKANLIFLKLFLFTIINVWLLYLISTRIELDKLSIESAWLDYLINLINSNLRLEMDPTIEFKLLVLLCVFFFFSIIFLKLIQKLGRSFWLGMSVLLVFMSKILYKVHDKFLTCGEDISFLGLTMEHVLSVKEKLTLLKGYIKNNNIIIDNQDYLLIWNEIKSLKKFDEVIETIEEMVEALKGKELSTIEYMYSLLTVPNVMMTLTGVTVVGGLLYIGYLGYNKLNNKIDENTEMINISDEEKSNALRELSETQRTFSSTQTEMVKQFKIKMASVDKGFIDLNENQFKVKAQLDGVQKVIDAIHETVIEQVDNVV